MIVLAPSTRARVRPQLRSPEQVGMPIGGRPAILPARVVWKRRMASFSPGSGACAYNGPAVDRGQRSPLPVTSQCRRRPRSRHPCRWTSPPCTPVPAERNTPPEGAAGRLRTLPGGAACPCSPVSWPVSWPVCRPALPLMGCGMPCSTLPAPPSPSAPVRGGYLCPHRYASGPRWVRRLPRLPRRPSPGGGLSPCVAAATPTRSRSCSTTGRFACCGSTPRAVA